MNSAWACSMSLALHHFFHQLCCASHCHDQLRPSHLFKTLCVDATKQINNRSTLSWSKATWLHVPKQTTQIVFVRNTAHLCLIFLCFVSLLHNCCNLVWSQFDQDHANLIYAHRVEEHFIKDWLLHFHLVFSLKRWGHLVCLIVLFSHLNVNFKGPSWCLALVFLILVIMQTVAMLCLCSPCWSRNGLSIQAFFHGDF